MNTTDNPRSWLAAAVSMVFLWLGCGGQQAAPDRAVSTAAPPAALQLAPTAEDPGETKPQKVVAKHLPNPWRIHPKVISGGLPASEAAFQELSDLGVKTIISVDGAKPDVETARKHGLRYIHMPHGYDGVPELRAKELAKAVRDLPGPIYIHCHHGKHRSPAAAIVACVGAGLLSPNAAVGVLKTAGTSENYRGLYQSAKVAQRLDSALLDELTVDYPATVQVPPIADAMISIEHTYDHLKGLAANQWQSLKEQPDLDPAHEALLLREHYTELTRTDEVKNQPKGFQELLADSEVTALTLEKMLTDWKNAGASGPPPEAIEKAFSAVSASCTKCHKAFRDVPLQEKVR